MHEISGSMSYKEVNKLCIDSIDIKRYDIIHGSFVMRYLIQYMTIRIIPNVFSHVGSPFSRKTTGWNCSWPPFVGPWSLQPCGNWCSICSCPSRWVAQQWGLRGRAIGRAGAIGIGHGDGGKMEEMRNIEKLRFISLRRWNTYYIYIYR